MRLIKAAAGKWKRLHRMSKLSFKLGAITMVCFYITALAALLIAPHGDYFAAMNAYRGCLEAAPASLAAGACAGLIGDLMLSRKGQEEDDKDGKL